MGICQCKTTSQNHELSIQIKNEPAKIDKLNNKKGLKQNKSHITCQTKTKPPHNQVKSQKITKKVIKNEKLTNIGDRINDKNQSQEQNKQKELQNIKTGLFKSLIQLFNGFFQKEQKKVQIQKIIIPLFECKICLGMKSKADFVTMCQCQHQFCWVCAVEYITQKIQDFQMIKCPDSTCQSVIDQKSNFYNQLPSITQQAYLKIDKFFKTSKSLDNQICEIKKCGGGIRHYDSQKKRICLICKSQYCRLCRLLKHSGKCEKNEARYLQRKLKFRQCKKCGFVVQKSTGCNHIKCRCKYQFCYICGGQWDGYQLHSNCTNPNLQQNQSLYCFDTQFGCCGFQYCSNTCGNTFSQILKLPFRLLFYLVFLIILLIVVLIQIVMLPFIIFTILIAGICVGSIWIICDFIQKNKICLAFIFILFFPLAICAGISKFFGDLFINFTIRRYNQSYMGMIRQFHHAIWD